MNNFLLLLRMRAPVLLRVSLLCGACGFIAAFSLFRHEASLTLDHVGLAEKAAGLIAHESSDKAVHREKLIQSFRTLVSHLAAHDVSEDSLGLTVSVRQRNLPELSSQFRALHDSLTGALSQLLEQKLQESKVEHIALASGIDTSLSEATRQLLDFQTLSGITSADETAGFLLEHLGRNEAKARDLQGQKVANEAQINLLLQELSRFSPPLVAAREALANALVHYTDESAKVKELRAAISALEAEAKTKASEGLDSMSWNSPEATALFSRLTELKSRGFGIQQEMLEVNRLAETLQNQIQNFPANKRRYTQLHGRYEVLQLRALRLENTQKELQTLIERVPAYIKTTPPTPHPLWASASITGLRWAGGLALLGFVAELLFLGLTHRRRRIRSASDLGRITKLPVLPPLPALAAISAAQRDQWAFDTFTQLRGLFRRGPVNGFVCGFVSSSPGQGCSTCVGLLEQAARRQGFRVMVIDASLPAREMLIQTTNWQTAEAAPAAIQSDAHALSLDVKHEFAAPLESSIWNFDQRFSWRQVSAQWGRYHDVVVLIELPPACVPESVLLAEQLPNVIWVCGSDLGNASETTLRLAQMRHVQTNLSACIFNAGPKARKRSLASRLSSLVGLIMALWTFSSPAQQQSPNNQPPTTNYQLPTTISSTSQAPEPSRSATDSNLAKQLPTTNHELPTTNSQPSTLNPQLTTNSQPSTGQLSASAELAEWQHHFTLGPGDVLEISLHDQPDTLRPGITIGPDGRINYLEARDLVASGLTVDELRAALEATLAKFHRASRVIVNPTAYTSKKYFVLGNVNQKGVFALDRPTSIIEAVAKAKGFATQVQSRNSFIQADLGRSFLVRRIADGAPAYVALDFEGLFLRGDLTQNIPLQPDDYLFFPPLGLQEVYVLGEVKAPGLVPYTPVLTALGAITTRAGFTEAAWKTRILVVRGSLYSPKSFVVNLADVLTAKGPDFPLANRDIVYVHRKPWAKAEELLESAATSFAQAFVVGIVGQKVPALITEPLIK